MRTLAFQGSQQGILVALIVPDNKLALISLADVTAVMLGLASRARSNLKSTKQSISCLIRDFTHFADSVAYLEQLFR